MRVECPNCGGAHPAWDCKRPAKKSTALRLDAATVSQGGRATAGNPDGKEARKQVQSLPVDTNNPSSRKGSGVESLRSSEPVVLNSANPQRLGRATRKDAHLSAPNTNSVPHANGMRDGIDKLRAQEGMPKPPVDTPAKRPRGRPRIHPDRKAYKAQWERDKRKRLKGVATEITSHALQSVIGTGFSKPSIDLHPDRIKSRAVDPKEG